VGTHWESSQGPTHTGPPGEAFSSESPAQSWKSHSLSGDQPELAFEVLWAEAAVSSNFSVLQSIFYIVIGIIRANLQPLIPK